MPYNDSDDEKEHRPLVAKTPADLQRLKLEKLMKNPDKPVIIPDRPKQKNTPSVPEFVRNVMGSSAGAGSGEFHVYRHLRRKEYARQKYIQEKSKKELLDEEYHQKLEENKKLAEDLTAKKRAKRLKKKQNLKKRKLGSDKKMTVKKEESDTSNSDSDSSDQEKPKSMIGEENQETKGFEDILDQNQVVKVVKPKNNENSADKNFEMNIEIDTKIDDTLTE